MAPQLEELRKLPLAEKLQIVEELWDDIGASDEPFPHRQWHVDEASRRAAELDANPEIALTREQVWERVDRNNG
jgi:putative addiction module component (TIGR02574 family)